MALPYPQLLTTDRLVLCRRDVRDAAVYREIWAERDARTPPHRRLDADGRPTLQDIAASIAADATSSQQVFYGVHRQDDLIGYCGLLFTGRGSTLEPELAYELLHRHHGRGYATEAARAVTQVAAAQGCHGVVAGVRRWNQPSLNVLRKLNFAQVGDAEPDAEFGDIFVLALPLRARPSART